MRVPINNHLTLNLSLKRLPPRKSNQKKLNQLKLKMLLNQVLYWWSIQSRWKNPLLLYYKTKDLFHFHFPSPSKKSLKTCLFLRLQPKRPAWSAIQILILTETVSYRLKKCWLNLSISLCFKTIIKRINFSSREAIQLECRDCLSSRNKKWISVLTNHLARIQISSKISLLVLSSIQKNRPILHRFHLLSNSQNHPNLFNLNFSLKFNLGLSLVMSMSLK